MIDFDWLLFPQWFSCLNVESDNNCKQNSLIIIGSWLDRNFLELLWRLGHTSFDNSNIFKITVVVLPISRSFRQNFQVISTYEQIRKDIPMNIKKNPIRFYDAVDRLINKVRDNIKSRQSEFYFQSLQIGRNKTSSIDFTAQENRFLFGSITAGFLRGNPLLPKFYLKDQQFNGIPVNFTLGSFIERIIMPELNKSLSHVNVQ
ncbi:MAG: hypothetical protein ACTSWL_09770 [Promethearchaeota archaeon]